MELNILDKKTNEIIWQYQGADALTEAYKLYVNYHDFKTKYKVNTIKTKTMLIKQFTSISYIYEIITPMCGNAIDDINLI